MNKVLKPRLGGWSWLGMGGLVCIILLTATSCEPIRKKFIRKKKEGQIISETVPLMLPEEYPVAARSVESLYRQNYSLALVWINEMMIAVQENESNKKLIFTHQKLISQLAQLKEFLSPAAHQKWEAINVLAQGIEKGTQEPQELRDKMKMVKQLRVLDKKIRKDLRPTEIAGSLVSKDPTLP